MILDPSAPLRTGFRLRILDSVRAKVQRLALIRVFHNRKRERLVRKYFFVSVILIAGGLISAGLLEIYFRYVEGQEQVGSTQQDAALSAAVRIERFIQDIATTMKAATKSAELSSPRFSKEYEFELKRLLFLAPAITEAVALDSSGIVQAQASRFRAVSALVGTDLSESAALKETRRGNSYFGTVYFRGTFWACCAPAGGSASASTATIIRSNSLDLISVRLALYSTESAFRAVTRKGGHPLLRAEMEGISKKPSPFFISASTEANLK